MLRSKYKELLMVCSLVVLIGVLTIAMFGMLAPATSQAMGVNNKTVDCSTPIGSVLVEGYAEQRTTIGNSTYATGERLYQIRKPYYSLLNRGLDGPCVTKLQKLLNGFCTQETQLVANGKFDARTYRAVWRTQYALRHYPFYSIKVKAENRRPQYILVDGTVGPQTWSTLQLFTGSYLEHRVKC